MLCKDITRQAVQVSLWWLAGWEGTGHPVLSSSIICSLRSNGTSHGHLPHLPPKPRNYMQKQSCWELLLVCCGTLCWAGDTLGIPRCLRCAAQLQPARPQSCASSFGRTHISWDGSSVANGDALLSAGCKQE